ncbi:hypothetical protein ACROYT_G010057 [Oculina patagonica]
MSQICSKISICVSFFIFTCVLVYVSFQYGNVRELAYSPDPDDDENQLELTFSKPEVPEVHCRLKDISGSSIWPLKTPSLESLIRASSSELRLSGLAVFSNLSDACQRPVDVSKSNIHVNKIALITIANEAECPLQDLVVNAQDAGYSVVIYFSDFFLPTQVASKYNGTQNDSQDKLLIPVLHTDKCKEVSSHMISQGPSVDDYILVDADRSSVEISVSQNTEDLKRMQTYLERLYYWFLLGPVITLEWLRRTKKFCCMSGGQQVHEDELSTEDEETVGETSLHEVVVGRQENFDQETEHEQSRGEREPLIAVNDPHANRTTTGHTGCLDVRRVVVPYCSFDDVSDLTLAKIIYFTTYNSVCTICNLLFIIILNKHKVVTRN